MILDPIDQRIRDRGFNFVPFDRYLASPFQFPTDQTQSGIASINQPLPIKSYVGGGGGSFTSGGGIDDLIQNFNVDTRNRYFGNMPTPLVDDLRQSKLDKTFLGFPSFREQELTGADLGEYIGTGRDVPLGLTTAGRIQQGLSNFRDSITGAGDKMMSFGPISFLASKMDKFGSLPAVDQEFIKSRMGYTGPTVFGENTSGLSKDPFGLNTRSLLGNYAERVGVEADKLTTALSPEGKIGSKFAGATYNPVTGMFELDDESQLTAEQLAAINKRTNMVRRKQQFYAKQTEDRDRDRQIAEENARREQEAALRRAQQEIAAKGYQDYGSGGGRDESLNTGPGGSYSGRGDQGATGANFSGDFATDSASYDLAKGGRVGYMSGGLADMLDIYD